MKKSVFASDLYRYYGEQGETVKRRLLRPLELKYLCAFRKAQESANVITKTYYKLKLRRISRKSQIQIPISAKIGKGFYIGHSGRIINSNAVLGENINIATGVTIVIGNPAKIIHRENATEGYIEKTV